MLFNTFEFIFLFVPIVFLAWLVFTKLSKPSMAFTAIICASLFFYSYWNLKYIILLLISIIFNFTIQNAIAKNLLQKHPQFLTNKILLYIGISFNLALISYYKYANFMMTNISLVFGRSWNYHEIFLPLGISFFTFQQIACLIDTYKGHIGLTNLKNYTFFVSFFPQLIAGPIVKFQEIIPQFHYALKHSLDQTKIQFGLCLFGFGLFKKVVIADGFSPIVGAVFDSTTQPMFLDAITGTLAYTMQIYFDFSGYSDMALGLGGLFGVKLPVNFDSPYKSLSVIDFWRRWHITLSQCLRDYIYIPLGGNRHGVTKKHINLMFTMLLGGLWHGAGWNFIIWGGMHGLYLIINNVWKQYNKRVYSPIAWGLTFTCVSVAWVFFRSPSVSRAKSICLALLNYSNFKSSLLSDFSKQEILLRTILALFICLIAPNSMQFLSSDKISCYQKAAIGGALLTIGLWMMTYSTRVSEFLYFQF